MPHAFLGEPWLGTWLATSGSTPGLLCCRDGDELRAAGFLAASRQRRLGGLVRSRRWNLNTSGDPAIDTVFLEYNGLIGQSADDPDPLLEALEYLDGQPGWDELHLHGLQANVAEALQRRWRRSRVVWEAPTYRIDLDELRRDGRDLLSRLSRNSRQQVRRAMKLYEERGPLSVRIAADSRESLAFFDDMKRLHIGTWSARGHDKGAFGQSYFETFHRHMITRHPGDHRVEMMAITAGNEPVGYLYNFVAGGHVHNYQCGFADEKDNRLKPGLVSHVMAIGHHMRNGAGIYDLLAGDQRYKSSLASPGPSLQSLVIWRARPGLVLEDLLRRARLAARDLAQRLTSGR
ncbi:MAG: GNAT family N-acetyltransferase [Geminicoccaceae bacterium]